MATAADRYAASEPADFDEIIFVDPAELGAGRRSSTSPKPGSGSNGPPSSASPSGSSMNGASKGAANGAANGAASNGGGPHGATSNGASHDGTAQNGGAPTEPPAMEKARSAELDPQAALLAERLFGAPVALALVACGMAARTPGWTIGHAFADSVDQDGLACWVNVDIFLLTDGRYVLQEHCATEGSDEMIASDASGILFDSAVALRTQCTERAAEPLRDAARAAALDDAMRKWPPLRRSDGRANATPLKLPFSLD